MHIFCWASTYARVVLGVVILSVRPSHPWIVTKLNDALQIIWYHTKGQSLCYSDINGGWWATLPFLWNLRSKWLSALPSRLIRSQRYATGTIALTISRIWGVLSLSPPLSFLSIFLLPSIPLFPSPFLPFFLFIDFPAKSSKILYKMEIAWQRATSATLVEISSTVHGKLWSLLIIMNTSYLFVLYGLKVSK